MKFNLMFYFAHEGSQRKTQKKKNSHKIKVKQRSIQRRKYKNREVLVKLLLAEDMLIKHIEIVELGGNLKRLPKEHC